MNGTQSKSVIISGPAGKQVTSSTSVYTSRFPVANSSNPRHATSEPDIGGSKSSDSNRKSILSPPRSITSKVTTETNRNLITTGLPATTTQQPPKHESSIHTNVDIKTHTKSPSPIRSQTTVESSWRSSLRNGSPSDRSSSRSNYPSSSSYDTRKFDLDRSKTYQQSDSPKYDTPEKGSKSPEMAHKRTSRSPSRQYHSSLSQPGQRSTSKDRRVRIKEVKSDADDDVIDHEYDTNNKSSYTSYTNKASWSSTSGDGYGEHVVINDDDDDDDFNYYDDAEKSSSRCEEFSSTIDIPIDGWSLKDAIKKKMLNPQTGRFNVSGSNYSISFRDCILLKIINPFSANVIEPGKSSLSSSSPLLTTTARTMSLSRALDRAILDEDGFYNQTYPSKRQLSLDEAIDRKYINFDPLETTNDLTSTRIIRIVKTNGKTDVSLIEPLESPLSSSSKPINTDYESSTSRIDYLSSSSPDRYSSTAKLSSINLDHEVESREGNNNDNLQATHYEEYVEISSNIFYSPASDTLLDEETGEKMCLKDALDMHIIEHDKFSIVDTLSGEPLSWNDAIKKGIFESKNYQVKDTKKGKTMPLNEAIKRGIFILSSSPFSLMESANSSYTSSSYLNLDDKIDPDLTSAGEGRVVRETVQVLKSREILIKDPESNQELTIDEALRRGLIDEEKANSFRCKDKDRGFRVQRSIDLTVHDPKTGKAISINEALQKGIIDQVTANRMKRGEIIENVIKTNVTVVDDENENWSDIVSEINQRLDLIQEFRQFQEAYMKMKKWLNEIESKIVAISTVNSLQASTIESNLQKIVHFREQFKSREKLLQNVDENGRSCQNRMEKESLEYSRIERLITSMHNQWDSCLSNLTQSESKLREIRSMSDKYFESVQKIERQLSTISAELESLSLAAKSISEKEKKIELIESKLTQQRSAINECESVCDQMCSLTSDTCIRSELRNRYNEIDRQYRELNRDIREMCSFLKDYHHHFEMKANDLENWQIATDLELKSEMQISTEEKMVQKEIIKTENIFKQIKSKEIEFEQLIDTGRDVMKSAINVDCYECKMIDKRMADIEKRWSEIRKSGEKRLMKLEKGLTECKRIRSQISSFASWLDEMEVEVSNLADIKCDRVFVEKQMSEIRKLKHSIREKEDDLKKISNISFTCFNAGVDQAKEEICTIKERFEELNKSIDTRSRSLEQICHKLVDYQGVFQDTSDAVKRFEDKLSSSDVMKSDLLESKLLDKTRSLVDESEIVYRKVVKTHEMATNISKEIKNGSDKMMQQINDYKNRIELNRKSLHERYGDMKCALNLFTRLSEQAETFERKVIKLESNVNKKISSTIANDSRSLETQSREITELIEESNQITSNGSQLLKMVQKESNELSSSFEATFKTILHQIQSSISRNEKAYQTLCDHKNRINEGLIIAREYESEIGKFEEWLTTTEKEVSRLEEASFLSDKIEKQIVEMEKMQQLLENKSVQFNDLEKRAPKSDKDLLITIKHRLSKLSSKCTDRCKLLDKNLKMAKEFVNKWSELMDWLSMVESNIESSETIASESSAINSVLSQIRSLSRELDSHHNQYESICKMGRNLRDKSCKSDSSVFQRMLDELKTKWTTIVDYCNESVKKLEKSRNNWEKFNKNWTNIDEWISRCTINMDKIHGDVDTVNRLIGEHKSFTNELRMRVSSYESLKVTSEELINSINLEQSQKVSKQMTDLEKKINILQQQSKTKEGKLDHALRLSEQFKRDSTRLMQLLTDIKSSVAKMDTNCRDKLIIESHLADLNRFHQQMVKEESNRDQTKADGQKILLDCYPDCELIIRRTIKQLESKWQEVSSKISETQSKLRANLDEIIKKMDKLDELLKWVKSMQKEMKDISSKVIVDNSQQIQELINELQQFADNVLIKQSEMDEIAQQYRIESAIKKFTLKSHRIRAQDISPDQISNLKAQEIIERWQNLLSTIDERMKHLLDKKEYYLELDKLREFDFDAWRRRFLDWIDARKAKLMDFYRKMDTDHDNKVNYEDFVATFLRSGFATSRAEMLRVAPIFDRNNDAFIDSKEWMDTLKDKSEEEIIKDEVQRQVAKCTCYSKYKVYQVEDRKYRVSFITLFMANFFHAFSASFIF